MSKIRRHRSKRGGQAAHTKAAYNAASVSGPTCLAAIPRFVLQLLAKPIILNGVMKKPFSFRILSIALTLCVLFGTAGLSAHALALPQGTVSLPQTTPAAATSTPAATASPAPVPTPVAATPTAAAQSPTDTPQPTAVPAPSPLCSSFLLSDLDSGEVLLSGNADERIFPASTTKIMTALVLLEQKTDLSETVTVGNELDTLSRDSSVMGLVKGETISLKDLLYGMMLVSGNDAAATIAVAVAGSQEAFAQLMNDKAERLGMKDTHFVNPHGLHDENHYTTASDMNKLAVAAMQNETFAQCVKAATYTTSATNKAPEGHALYTTNKLISTRTINKPYNYAYATGIKTGYTDAAKGCLVASAEKDGRKLIAIIFGDSSLKENDNYYRRWTDSKALFAYGFNQVRVDLTEKIKAMQLSAVLPGDTEESNLTPRIQNSAIAFWTDEQSAQTMLSDDVQLTVSYEWKADLASPRPTNAIVGTAIYGYAGREIYRCEVMQSAKRVQVVEPVAPELVPKFRALYLTLFGMAGAMLLLMIIHFFIRRTLQRNLRRQSLGHSKKRRIPRGGYDMEREVGRRRRSGKLRDPHDYR